MLEFSVLIFKNLGRNRLRTALTMLALLTLTVIYSMVRTTSRTIEDLIRVDSSQNRLIVRERWTFPSRFPRRYVREISQLPGVKDWTTWNSYVGSWDGSTRDDRLAIGVATRMDNLRSIHTGLDKLDPELVAQMDRERIGALVGPQLLKVMNLQVGQYFEVTGRSHAGKNLRFHIVGELPTGPWSHTFFFRDDYYNEGTGDDSMVALMWLQVATPEDAQRLAAEIDSRYAKAQDQLRAETESAGVGRVASRTTALMTVINIVIAVLMIDMVIILANSISITTRERHREMAILKVLGFEPRFIRGLVIGESMLVGFIGGGLGAVLIFLISWLNQHYWLPWSIQFLHQFPVPSDFILNGFLMGAGVGFLGSIVPAWNAPKVRVVDVFSKVT